MSLQSFLQWWNLAFELPFLLALAYTLLLATGTVGGEEGADADVDHDLHHGVEHTLGTEHHAVPHESATEGGLARALGFLGVGRVPLSIIVVTLLYVFGFTGWAGNQLFDGLGWTPEWYFWLSALLALTCSLLLTRMLAFRLAKVMPGIESYGIKSNADLIGHLGVTSHTISDAFGIAQVKDGHGSSHQVYCRTVGGAESIPPGTPVRLQEYDPEKREFIVIAEADFEAQLRRR